MAVRVRFAPSPTGYLHIGGLRTALFCYLFARAEQGTFVLRIEDTDRTRFVADAEDDIVGSLRWAGLEVDEGPHLGSGYRQSERTAFYRCYAQLLLDSGHAYHAFDTPETLRTMRNQGAAYNMETRGEMCNDFTLSANEVGRRIQAGENHVVRLRVPEHASIAFTDTIKGSVAFAAESLTDQILLKSDGRPTYHLANVIDDHLMGITHVIRGEEWLPSTPKHMLLYEFLGWSPPVMAHLPLILSPLGGKLSKRSATRQGIPVNVRDYIRAGYEPEALVNFLALLGWHPSSDREVFTREELIAIFSLNRVTPSPAQFDLDKLRWFNQQHLRLLGPVEVGARVASALKEAYGSMPETYVQAALAVVGERLVLRDDLASTYGYCFADPSTYETRGVRKRWKADAADLVSAYAQRLQSLSPFDARGLEAELRSLAKQRGVGAGRIIHPVRLAVSGTTVGPSLFELLVLLGRDSCMRRLSRAVRVLG